MAGPGSTAASTARGRRGATTHRAGGKVGGETAVGRRGAYTLGLQAEADGGRPVEPPRSAYTLGLQAEADGGSRLEPPRSAGFGRTRTSALPLPRSSIR
jgi:hypothetical protein